MQTHLIRSSCRTWCLYRFLFHRKRSIWYQLSLPLLLVHHQLNQRLWMKPWQLSHQVSCTIQGHQKPVLKNRQKPCWFLMIFEHFVDFCIQSAIMQFVKRNIFVTFIYKKTMFKKINIVFLFYLKTFT